VNTYNNVYIYICIHIYKYIYIYIYICIYLCSTYVYHDVYIYIYIYINTPINQMHSSCQPYGYVVNWSCIGVATPIGVATDVYAFSCELQTCNMLQLQFAFIGVATCYQ